MRGLAGRWKSTKQETGSRNRRQSVRENGSENVNEKQAGDKVSTNRKALR